MYVSTTWPRRVGLMALTALAACGPAAAGSEPGVRPTPSAPPSAPADAQGGQATRRGYVEADVRFMQGMLAHHAQAVEMTALVPQRASRDDVRLLSQRIEVSQRDETLIMQRWLAARNETVPGPHAHHGEHAGMPGMLTAQEMARMAAASGPEFDRLFLEGMIRHHEGALQMVAALFDSPGAAQDSEMFQFASDVDADQRAEIARMRTLLNALRSAAPRR